MKHGVRYRVLEVVIPALLVTGSMAVGVMATRPAPSRSPRVTTTGASFLAASDRLPGNLDALSDKQIESALSVHPQLVGMRLALVERYLREREVKKAATHAHLALQQNPDPAERQAILKYLGWSTALLGQPVQGAKLLEESIQLNPADLDARWFLANVVLHGLGDPQRASALLEELLRSPMADQTRGLVEAKLADARARAAAPATPEKPDPRG